MRGPMDVKPRRYQIITKASLIWSSERSHFALWDSGDYRDETAGGAFEPVWPLQVMNDSPSSVPRCPRGAESLVYWEKVMMQTIDCLPLSTVWAHWQTANHLTCPFPRNVNDTSPSVCVCIHLSRYTHGIYRIQYIHTLHQKAINKSYAVVKCSYARCKLE